MRSAFTRPTLAVAACLAIVSALGPSHLASAAGPATIPASTTITARQLVQPYALMGPGPSSFAWSPGGAVLAYVEPRNGHDVLWTWDAASATKRVLLDPGSNPNGLDLTTAQWSPQSDRIVLVGSSALFLLDVGSGALQPLEVGTATTTAVQFSPDGAQLAFAQANDLWVVRLADGKLTRLTRDGSSTVFNGTLDWVYNEELATRSAQPAYAWSPDGKRIVHLRLDEADVQNHPVTDYRTTPPTVSWTRYPTVGTANPRASVHVVDVATGARATVPLDADVEYVLPFFSWTPDGNEALFVTENRAHTLLRLTGWNPATARTRVLVTETDPRWINENSYAPPLFVAGGTQFLWLSERDGYMHLYLYSLQGELLRQLTQGEWMIDSPAWNVLVPGRPVFTDPSGRYAWFEATKNGPLERQIYRLEIATGKLDQVSQRAGFHQAALSGDGNYLVDQFSDVATPTVTTIMRSDGTAVATLAQCAGPSLPLPNVQREFLTVKARDGTPLYAQLVKPANFDPTRRYPVIVHWYGGPTLQLVSNRYGATNIFNHIERDVLYTQEDFLVWRLDNRGSFGRGHDFETPIWKELGKVALEDQLSGIDTLRSLPYVDATRIGSDGKSFGGFLTLYALIHAPEVFNAGVAGSAPTNWAWYDTIYTERYMRTPAANPDGYAKTNLVSRASELQVAPLIIHGLADQNVHLENSINFVQALEAIRQAVRLPPVPNLDHSYTGNGLVSALAASTDYFTRMLGGGP